MLSAFMPRAGALALSCAAASLLAVLGAAPARAEQALAEPARADRAPLPPGSPLIGRPDTEAAKLLAPIAPPPAATAADKLPLDKLKVKAGFKIELYAAGVVNARTLSLGEKGTVFVGTRLEDKVHAILERNGKREVKVVASRLNRPNGIALHQGTLYIAELNQISKIEKIEDNLDLPPQPTLVLGDLPKEETHGWKTLTVGPDERLYFQVGAPCNICLPSERHGKIYRVGLDGKGLEVFASGIRQIVGMDWHPVLKQLYFSENARDWLSEDAPEDKLNRVTRPGQDNFGFPYCHQGNFPDPEFGWGRSCGEFTKPIALLGPHAAALGLKFFTSNGFGAEYRDAIFLARHGSWNRSIKFGGDVVAITLYGNGSVRSIEPFITGFIQNNAYIGRPVDVLPMQDGSLLVSDDFNGAVYRVSRSGGRKVEP
jgi:glucose/arabinose dehydrogenase